MTETAEQLREQAAAYRSEAHESFERCDTDGFVSQWASGVSARERELQAEVAEAGGRWEFPALFDTSGAHVPAKLVSTRYGWSWIVLNEQGELVRWFNPSRAQDEAKARAANARKGYYIGRVSFPATVVVEGSGTGLSGALTVHPIVVPVSRNDLAQGRGIEIIDNGQ